PTGEPSRSTGRTARRRTRTRRTWSRRWCATRGRADGSPRSPSARVSVRRVVPVTAVFQDVGEADAVLGLGRVARRARNAGHLDPWPYERAAAHPTTAPFFAPVTLFVVVAER